MPAVIYHASSLLRVGRRQKKEKSLTFPLSPLATAESMLLSERWIPLGAWPADRLSPAQMLRIENASASCSKHIVTPIWVSPGCKSGLMEMVLFSIYIILGLKVAGNLLLRVPENMLHSRHRLVWRGSSLTSETIPPSGAINLECSTLSSKYIKVFQPLYILYIAQTNIFYSLIQASSSFESKVWF